MIIQYAGEALLTEDPGHEFQVWLEQTMSTQDMAIFAPTDKDSEASSARPRGTLLGREAPDVGLPMPNFSSYRPPQWKINTLWWPTGASRYAIGLFLADTGQKDKILASTSYGAARLVISDELSSDKVSTTMYLMQPRPITSVPGANGLWLIVVVDDRYFWQGIGTGNIDVDETTTWTQLYGKFATELGITISSDTVDSNYNKPDPIEFKRKYANVAHALDATAASVGHRIVRTTGATVKAIGLTTTNSLFSTESTKASNTIAGGKSTSIVYPAEVVVTFPKRNKGRRLWPDGDVFKVTKTASQLNVTGIPSTSKIFHSSAQADLPSASATPVNNAALASLATQIATDYVGHLKQQYDNVFSGIVPWDQSGYDDWIWWHAGYQNKAESMLLKSRDPSKWQTLRDYEVSTRVVSHPPNFAVTSQLQQLLVDTRSGTSVIEGIVNATITAVTATFKLNTVLIIVGDDPRVVPGDAAELVTVNNHFGQVYTVGDKIIAMQREDSNIGDNYEPIAEKQGGSSTPLIHFELQDNMNYDATQALAVQVLSTGLADTGGADFYVLDNSNRYAGYKPRTGQGTGAGTDRGYRGYAEFVTADHQSSGKAAYKIIEMEFTTYLLVGECTYVSGTSGPREWDMSTSNSVSLPLQGEGRDPDGFFSPAAPVVRVKDLRGLTDELNASDKQELTVAWDDTLKTYVVIAVLGGTAGTFEIGWIESGVAAATYDYAAKEATPGVVVNGITLMVRAGVKLVAKTEDDPNFIQQDPPIPVPQVNATRYVCNLSKTAIRASTDQPILGTGHLWGSGTGNPWFVVTNIMDFRALPGHATGVAGTVADAQIPFHAPGDDSYQLAADLCPPPAP